MNSCENPTFDEFGCQWLPLIFVSLNLLSIEPVEVLVLGVECKVEE